jgi:hypothetical protein
MSKKIRFDESEFKLGNVIVRVVLFFPLAFGMFHLFIFSIWYYWSIEPITAVILSTAILLPCSYRLAGFLPLPRPTNSDRFPFLPQQLRPLRNVGSIIEVLFWYAILVIWYLHLNRSFNFPQSLEQTPSWAPVLLGYGVFFLIAFTINPMMALLGESIWHLIKELRRFRNTVRRLVTVLSTFLVLDLIFSAIYMFLSIHDSSTFEPHLTNFADAFHFSTLTITILGAGDFKPLSSIARSIAAFETLTGILFLAAVLAFILSIPPEETAS